MNRFQATVRRSATQISFLRDVDFFTNTSIILDPDFHQLSAPSIPFHMELVVPIDHAYVVVKEREGCEGGKSVQGA